MSAFPKYISRCIYKVVLFFVCCLSFHISFCQQEEPPVAADTVVAAEEPDVETNAEDKPEKYFLSKPVFESDTDTIQYRAVPDSIVKLLQNDDAFWYANAEFEKQKPAEIQPGDAKQPWYQTLVWIIIVGAFIAVLIWYLAVSNVGIFRKSSKVIGQAETDIENENIFEINYQKEIEKAVQAGNYRLAVRLMFLQLLKTLSEKQVIAYKQERTNFDYLLQLHSTGYYKDFFRITRNYEYAWYGQFDVSPEAFTIMQNEFENFSRKLN